jgi:hypothetical protein
LTSTVQVASSAPAKKHNLKQWIKGIVYALLLINWGFYIADDMSIAAHTLRADPTFLDWTSAFATSFDEAAWFILLFVFELETYLLSDESFTPTRVKLMHGLRLVCYCFLAHTLYAYAGTAADLLDVDAEANTTQLCQLLDRDLSFGSNLEYTTLDESNCQTLSTDTQFYLIENGTVVTDTRGLRIERELTTIDLTEATVWLLILFFIELILRLQEKGITQGPLLRTAIILKFGLYCLLWCAVLYWLYRGHTMYAWDEALWIFGFMAIGMNLSDWRDEMVEEAEGAAQP